MPLDRKRETGSDDEMINERISDPDDQLVEAVAMGDADAMQAMIDRKLPRLMALATRMLGDPAEAEDVVQETFIRIWKHAARWEQGNAKFDTWIHRVALNLCYDRLKRKKEYLMAELPENSDYCFDPMPGHAFDGLTGFDVQRALQAIAPRQREAIILVYYQDMSNRDAADVMHLSVDALESLLSRGRRALHVKLGEPQGD
ncbi:MAG: RNA polymerase sigma factor [Rhizobium sp.]